MGRRTNLRLAQSKPPLGQGFRGFDRQRQSLGLHRLRAAARPATVLPITQPIRLRFGHLAKAVPVVMMLALRDSPWGQPWNPARDVGPKVLVLRAKRLLERW